MRFALVNPTKQLLDEIADTCFKQKDVALTYALAMNEPDEVDWPKVNQAIIERWSMAGLKRVKEMAWKRIEEQS